MQIFLTRDPEDIFDPFVLKAFHKKLGSCRHNLSIRLMFDDHGSCGIHMVIDIIPLKKKKSIMRKVHGVTGRIFLTQTGLSVGVPCGIAYHNQRMR